jgi:hypothetical protein
MPSRTLQRRSLQCSGKGVPHPERTAGGDLYGTIDPSREKSQERGSRADKEDGDGGEDSVKENKIRVDEDYCCA